ncbi:MAG: hypothetical protein AABY22_36085 [Nanoarchaeota archaeon]
MSWFDDFIKIVGWIGFIGIIIIIIILLYIWWYSLTRLRLDKDKSNQKDNWMSKTEKSKDGKG